jgi:hypothetical protein
MKNKDLNKLESNDLTIISHEIHDTHFSIRIKCEKANVDLWADYSIEDEDISMEWNMYIFFDDNKDDMRIKKFQDNCNAYEIVSSAGISYLEEKNLITQDEDGAWFMNI